MSQHIFTDKYVSVCLNVSHSAGWMQNVVCSPILQLDVRGEVCDGPFLCSCSLSPFLLLNKLRVELLPHTHTHINTHRAPWLHHYSGKEHPKQAHPNLTTRAHMHTQTHTYTGANIYTNSMHTCTDAHKHAALQIVFRSLLFGCTPSG